MRPALDYHAMVREFCNLRLSQRRSIAEQFGVEVVPGEPDMDRVKKTIKAVVDQGKQVEFAELIAEANK